MTLVPAPMRQTRQMPYQFSVRTRVSSLTDIVSYTSDMNFASEENISTCLLISLVSAVQYCSLPSIG